MAVGSFVVLTTGQDVSMVQLWVAVLVLVQMVQGWQHESLHSLIPAGSSFVFLVLR